MVMMAAAAKTSPACCALSIQRCDSLLAVARLRRGANSPRPRFQTCIDTGPAALASRPRPPRTHAATSLPHCPWRPRRSAAATVGCPRSIGTCPERQRRAARQRAARSTPRLQRHLRVRHGAIVKKPAKLHLARPVTAKATDARARRATSDACSGAARFPGDDRQIAPGICDYGHQHLHRFAGQQRVPPHRKAQPRCGIRRRGEVKSPLYAAGFATASSLASRCNSALLIAACRVGALICAPRRSVT